MFISAQKHLFWTGVFFHQWGDPPHWWKNTPGPKTAILGRNPNYKIVKNSKRNYEPAEILSPHVNIVLYPFENPNNTKYV